MKTVERLRIAAIRFLNPAPLMWDFEHGPRAAELAERYELAWMMPSECAARLAAGTAEIGLVPLPTLVTIPGLQMLPGCAIASKGAIRSLLLVYPEGRELASLKTIAADTSSRATLAYTETMFRKWWSPAAPPVFVQHRPVLGEMLQSADAAMLIGDPALIAMERPEPGLVYLDLAAEWRKLTGLPWISAIWGVRAGVAVSDALRADFLASRDAGMANIDALVAEWRGKLAVSEATIREYLTRNIHYVLDEECLEGIRVFLAYAAEVGVLPARSM